MHEMSPPTNQKHGGPFTYNLKETQETIIHIPYESSDYKTPVVTEEVKEQSLN